MKDLIHSKNNAMYSTISEYLIQSIYEGKYENEKFPSIRKAAEIFNVSIITIKSAYQILEKLDIIVANPKTGYIISEDAKDKILEMKKEELKQLIFKAESIWFCCKVKIICTSIQNYKSKYCFNSKEFC